MDLTEYVSRYSAASEFSDTFTYRFGLFSSVDREIAKLESGMHRIASRIIRIFFIKCISLCE